MYCLNCLKLINSYITYKSIFKVTKDHICERCFMNLTLIQKMEAIPIDNYLLYLNTLFDDFDEPMALMSFLKPYYLYYLKTDQKNIFLYFDTFNDNVYSIIRELNLSNIFLVVLKKEFVEENKYED